MSNLKLLSKTQRLDGMKFTAFTFQNHGRDLHLSFTPYKGGHRFPQCNRHRPIAFNPSTDHTQEILTFIGINIAL